MKKYSITNCCDSLKPQKVSGKLTSSVRLKSEFDLIKSEGTKLVGENFVMLYLKNNGEEVKIGIICGRKYDVRAVVRNRIRRIFKEAFRIVRADINCPVSIIFIPKKNAVALKTQDIHKSMVSAFKKASLLSND